MMKKILLVLGGIVIVGLGIWWRFDRLEESWLFFGDTGRDYLEVWRLVREGKILFLGPQTSGAPLNQSPIYFYLLTPIMVASNFAWWSGQVTLLLFMLGSGAIGWLVLRRQAVFRWSYGWGWLLAWWCPLLISQSREVWNPSFVWPSLNLAWWLVMVSNRWRWKKWCLTGEAWALIGAGVMAALAVAFNFSSVPAVVALGVIVVIKNGRRWWGYGLGVIGGMLGFFAPMLAFEIRYQFQLTRRFLGGLDTLGSAMGQSGGMGLGERLVAIGQNVTGNWLIFWAAVIIVGGWLGNLLLRKKLEKWREEMVLLAWLGLMMTVGGMLIFPTAIFSHYVFGILTFFLVMVVSLPRGGRYVMVGGLALYWLVTNLGVEWQRAVYTHKEADKCAAEICASEWGREPLFVSGQMLSSHNHAATEQIFLLKKHGCTVWQIDFEPKAARRMIVFNVGNELELGKSAYNELTLFGEAEKVGGGRCGEAIEWEVLGRVGE
jgi:hypothetical protein